LESLAQLQMSIEETKYAAIEGDKNAQYHIGYAYLHGSDGLDQNVPEAVKWFQTSADQGHVEAQLELGNAYFSGVGVAQNLGTAFELYVKAAESGSADAQNNVGAMYGKGVGVALNYEDAVKWLKLAGRQGHHIAQNSLGLCYLYGNGVKKDLNEALFWITASADGPLGGYIEAQFNLGQCYMGACLWGHPNEAIEATVNGASAIQWFSKAAGRGHTEAQFELGKILLSSGVFKRSSSEINEGLRWLKMASDNGHLRAAEILQRHLTNSTRS
jgi:TPR repeat protein